MSENEAKQDEAPVERDWVEGDLHWFEHDVLGCKFAVPERVTTRVHAAWVGGRSKVINMGILSDLACSWVSAAEVIKDWECEALPDFQADLKDIANEQLAIIHWVGKKAREYILAFTRIPKN